MSSEQRYHNFADFYPFYLSEHTNRVSRRLHFVGTSIALALLVAALFTQAWWLVYLNVFVPLAQLFQKIPALAFLARAPAAPDDSIRREPVRVGAESRLAPPETKTS